ncbi:hypothetical protein AW27_018595 [Streptomyces sp. PCS3-D2]|uniref:hypothetical protein n=1 Tax=Streptomyces sp. PCS3-D2 TaxID=1460244 RepID=UPI000446F339|nr:hypothetical protein [Streptomyces sp. PCS3-D2]WKV73353.1 hypothetical protein AW27_018595 [Streptomyces sp. PCS3-D2]
MSERDREWCEAALEGFFEVAVSWEFELAWKLCWLEKDFTDAGWKGGPPEPAPRDGRGLLGAADRGPHADRSADDPARPAVGRPTD